MGDDGGEHAFVGSAAASGVGFRGPGRGESSGASMKVPPDSEFEDPLEESLAGLMKREILELPRDPSVLAHSGGLNLVRLLGAGGMGLVFLAEHESVPGPIAAKVLRPELTERPQLVRRFREEVGVLRRLAHPHIVPLVPTERRVSDEILLMPYYSQGSLRNRLRQGASLVRAEMLLIAIQLAEALSYAHARLVLHGDIKPENILLEQTNHVRLADFGLARGFDPFGCDPDLSRFREGTLPYLSPQGAVGDAEDTRADIYAFGAVLYEMLTGKAPYFEQSREVMRHAIRDGAPTRVTVLCPQADPDLVRVCERAMARRLRDRYATMEDVLEDLQQIKRGLPLESQKPFAPRAGRLGFFWRWRLAIGLLAMVIVVLLGLVIGRGYRLEQLGAFDSRHVTRWEHASGVQWDGLPGLELSIARPAGLLIFDKDGALLCDWKPDNTDYRWSKAASPLDLDGDGRPEIAYMRGDEQKTVIEYVNQHPKRVAQFEAKSSPLDDRNFTFTTELVPDAVVSPSASMTGRRSLIAMTTTYYSDPSAGPWNRGVIAFDIETGEALWQYLTGGPPGSISVCDLNGDNKSDVVFATATVNNGNIAPDGSSDSAAYLYALSQSGELMWRKELGGIHSGLVVIGSANVSGNDPEIYVRLGRGEWGYEADGALPSRLIRLDGEGQITGEVVSQSVFVNATTLEFDEQAKPEILAVDREGRAVLLRDFEVVAERDLATERSHWETKWDRVEAQFLAPGRYLSGSEYQIAVMVSARVHYGEPNPGNASQPPSVRELQDARLIVLDRDLETVASFPVPQVEGRPDLSGRYRGWDMDGDGRLEIVWLGSDVRIFSLERRMGW